MISEVGRHRTVPLLVAGVGLALEALVSLAFAVLQLLTVGPGGRVGGIVTAVAIAAYAGGLGVLAWGVAQGRRWSRAPAIVLQLIQIAVAWGLRGSPTTAIAWAAVLVSAVVVVCVLLPSSTVMFVPEADQRPGGGATPD